MSKGFSAWWLGIMYLIGGYIRKYGLLSKIKASRLGILYVFSVLFDFFKRYVYDHLYFYKNGEMPFYEDAMNYMSITMVVAAICLFLLFERLQIEENRFTGLLLKVSVMNFSIYLIHVNGLVWDNLIMNRFAFIVDYNILLGTVITLIICMLIYVACLMIDYPREMIFNHLNLKRRISNIENRLTQRIDCMTQNRRRFFE